MMMMTTKKKNKSAIVTVRTDSDVDRLVCVALKAADSNSIDGVERCFDTLRCLRDLNLSCKDLYRSKSIVALADLNDHGNPKIRMAANLLFTSWMKTLYSDGRQVTTCNKVVPLSLKKPNSHVAKVCSDLKKKKQDQTSHDVVEDTKQKTVSLSHCESFAANPLQTQKQTIPVTTKVSETLKYCPSFKSVRVNTCTYVPNKPGLMTKKKPDGFKSFESKPILAKKRSALPMKLSENPRKSVSTTTTRTLQIKKKQPPVKVSVKVSQNPKHCPALKKNSTEMLELFEVAKKSADVANTKGLLLAKAETSICVDTLSLLIGFPISSTATETRKIMDRLAHLTKHKDRKICNSATALFQHWSQSIRDQQHKDALKTQV